MPFRRKFCYISNSSYICIAVPGVPLSDVSADDESGFFLFTNLISFATTKIRIGRGPRCRYGRCRRNRSSLRRRRMDIFEGAKEFGTFLETRGNANQNPKRYERHYQTCFISSIGSCGHSGPCQQLRPVKRRKLYNFTQQFFIIA